MNAKPNKPTWSNRGGRQGVQMAREGLSQSADRSADLLRSRLRSVAIIIALAIAIGVLRGLLSSQHVWLPATLVVLGFFVALVFLLGRSGTLSFERLRIVETALFALVFIYVFGRNIAVVNDALLGEGTGFSSARVAPTLASFRVALASVLLMIVKGLILPGSWRRAAAFCVPMALAALLFPGILGAFVLRESSLNPAFGGLDHYLEIGSQVAVGLLIAVFGSHAIQMLRLEVSAGRKVGQYELLKLVGEGGMGQVWLARHGLLARPAAIKLISASQLSMPGESAGTALSRFEQEARATAQLRSPHTIQIFDFGSTDDGSFYYAMEYLEGFDLGTLVSDYGPIAEDRTISIMIQACESLAEAHASGMVHRDIKPQNIFLCRLGLVVDFVKVLDFGLVKIKDDSLDLSQGDIVGTPAFLPPEMGRGEAVDGRTDVYALACVAYWLLTGRFVFNAKSGIEMAMAHMQNLPGRPSSVSDEPISEAMDRLIVACLAKDPIARPSGVAEFAERLREIDPGTWTETKALAWWDLHQPRD